MSREEATKIVDKVKIYRQSFLITNQLYQEWFRILEPYDYEDVDIRLSEYFKNGDNFGKYPDVYYLTKYLKKHDEKLKVGLNYVRCQLCNELIDLENYDEHYERCSSTNYLCNMSEKYFHRKLNREKLKKATKEEFENYYWNFCKKLIDIMPSDNILKRPLEKAIFTHRGLKLECTLQEVCNDRIIKSFTMEETKRYLT